MAIAIWFKNALTTLRESLYNPIYVLLIGAITYFSWATGNSLLGIATMFIIISIVLIINEDILPILPCLLFVIFNTSKSNILENPNTFPILAVLVIILIGAVVSHLISYPIKIKMHKLTFPLIAVTIALFTGGISFLSFKEYAYGLTFILSLGPFLLFFYYLILSFLNPPNDVDYKKYTCYILIVLGGLIAAQMFTYILKTDKNLSELVRDTMDLGWGNRNSIGMLLNICFPCCFYMAYKNKKLAWLYYALGFCFYACIIATFSRGGILASTIAMICLIVYSFLKGNNRSQLICTIAIISIAVSFLALVRLQALTTILDKLSSIEFSTSGRDELYAEALNNFVENPVFGAGIGYIGNIFKMPEFCMYWYHSTLFQIIGSMGIVGICAYGYFYAARFAIMFKNIKQFNFTISLGIIAFEIHSLFDAGTFMPFPTMVIIIALTCLLEYSNAQDKNSFLKSVQL